MTGRSDADQYGQDGTFEPAPPAASIDPLSGSYDSGGFPQQRHDEARQPDAIAQPVQPLGPDAEAVRQAMDDLLAGNPGETGEPGTTGAQQDPESATEAAPEGQQPAPAQPQGPRAWPGRPTGELVRMAWRPVQNRLKPSRSTREDESEQVPRPAEEHHLAGKRRQGIPAGAVAVFVLAITFVVVAYFMIASLVDSISSLFS